MREGQGLRCAAAAVFLLTAALLRADCVSSEQAITQPGFFPSHVAGPVATNGTVVGVAKSDTSTGAPAIFFATYDSDLNRIVADRQVAGSSVNGAAALIWNGREFALFYQAPSLILLFQRLDADGDQFGPPLPIANHPWSPDDELSIAWVEARDAYAIARTVTQGPDRGLWLTVVSITGQVLTDTQVSVFITPPVQPQVFAIPDGRVGVLWVRHDETPALALAVVSASGAMRTATVSDREILTARAATDGTTILVIFSSRTSSGGSELRYAQFDLNANRTRGDSLFLAAKGVDIVPSQLMWNPTLSEWALTYVDAIVGLNVFPGEVRLRRFTSPTATPSDTLFSQNLLHSRLAAPYPLVFLDGAYIGSIQRIISRTEGSESYLVKLCPVIVTATVDHPVWRPFLPVKFTASASGGTPPYTYDWQFGDNDTARGTAVLHVYQNPGTYTVTLTATDAEGGVSTTHITVVITLIRKEHAIRH